MENLSKEDKKKLFMNIIEQAKRKGIRGYEQYPGDAMYEAGYWDNNWKIKNNGVLGLEYGGVTSDGKETVILTIGGGLDECRYGEHSDFIKTFDDVTQLSEFLDSFFDMNNMQAINEFAPSNEFFTSENKYEGDKFKFCGCPLEYLHMYDCLMAKYGEQKSHLTGVYSGKFGEKYSSDTIVLEWDYSVRKVELLSKTYGNNYKEKYIEEFNYDSRTTEDGDYKADYKDLSNLFDKAISDVPQIYEDLKKGTYSKDKYVTLRTPLQQREDELSYLEVEAKKISEAEALIDQQKEGQDIGEK